MNETERMARGLRAVWERRARGGVVHRIDGLVVALTNLPDQQENVALVEASPADPGRAIQEAEKAFAAHGLKLGLDLERGRHPAVEHAVRAHGFRVVVTRPGMVLDLHGYSAPPTAPGVETRLVTDEAGRSAFIDVQCAVFEMEQQVAEGLMPSSDLRAGGVRLYLGFIDGRPAAAAIAYVAFGTLGIFGVATLPGARRRGLGRAVTAQALNDGKAVADLAWLQSSQVGLPLYDAMGFRAVCDWDVWAR
jgi:ribosomal protein S18 acetylase RimI-like enzyme